MKKYVLYPPLLFLLCFLIHGSCFANDADIINCSEKTSCIVKTFRSDIPEILTQHTLSVTGGFPVGSDNQVTVNLDGASTTLVCNDTWQPLGPSSASQSLQNQFKCVVDTDREFITADVILHDQMSLDNTYTTQPSVSGFSYLSGYTATSPYCITEAANSAEACQYETQAGADWYLFSETSATQLKIGVSDQPDNPELPEENICANDMDDNGVIENWEWGTCDLIDDESEYMCLLDAAECTETTSEPVCLDGGTFNSGLGICEKAPSDITCPSNYTYNQSLDICQRDPYCADGGAFNPNTNRCEIIVSDSCPPGYSYDSSSDMCVKNPDCPDGGIYDPSADMCKIAIIKTCDPGLTYNASRNTCESAPLCASGFSYNPAANLCTDQVTMNCPTGYIEQNGVCVSTPVCPPGGNYNETTNRCEFSKSTTLGVCTSFKTNCNYTYKYKRSDLLGTTIKFPCSSSCTFANDEFTYKDTGGSWTNCDGDSVSAPPLPSHSSSSNCEKTVYYGGKPQTMNLCLMYENYACQYINGTTKMSYMRYGTCDTYYKCSLNDSEYSTESECNSNCIETTPCPTGYTDMGSICVANPTCTQGGSLNGTTDYCEIQLTYNCSQGSTYDPGLSMCTTAATCSSGTLNTTTDQCESVVTDNCPGSYTVNGNSCEIAAVCNQGFFNPTTDRCELSASSFCPSSYSFSSAEDRCIANFQCFNSSIFSDVIDKCTLSATHTCDGNYSYSGSSRQCEAGPICEAGAYRPDTKDCYEGDNTCPYGPQFNCKTYQGRNICSPYSCFNVSDEEQDIDTVTGENDKDDQGEYDDAGNCLGNIYIYNGTDNRCRDWGWSVLDSGCCRDDTFLLGTMDCNGDEKMLSMRNDKGLCHYVGRYCSKDISLPFGGDLCTEKKKTYCCFNSKLGRIIHQQGRPQLIQFSQEGWGSPENPNCRGFTPEEFQMLNFNKIDLGEWAVDIEVKATGTLQGEMSDKASTSDMTSEITENQQDAEQIKQDNGL